MPNDFSATKAVCAGICAISNNTLNFIGLTFENGYNTSNGRDGRPETGNDQPLTLQNCAFTGNRTTIPSATGDGALLDYFPTLFPAPFRRSTCAEWRGVV
ncbi:MAG: hypothetical protein LBJ11_07635 [Oscillospiraceae bacterium]|nr:hypothetical protein [Oscillospiraceae bacterium]